MFFGKILASVPNGFQLMRTSIITGAEDDAFPTADACVHGGEQFPNLGELRSLAWAVEELKAGEETAAISLSAFGPISAIKATKRIRLVGQQVRLDFAIEGLGPLAVDFLWGTHPSFAVQAGTRLIIPAHTGIVGSASHPSLGSPGLRYEWPYVKGHHGTTDMSLVQEISAGVACGHYLTDLEDGWFAVETNGNGVLFEFPVERCPCLWLWLVYGGWRGYHHAIVEPWTGYPVDLEQAAKQGRANTLMPGTKFAVTVRCTTYCAPESFAVALRRVRNQ